MIKIIRNYLIKKGILDFKVGDKVKPNPKIFKNGYKLILKQEYAVIRSVTFNHVYIYGTTIPYAKKELVLA